MLNAAVQQALNHQIQHELYSAYVYLSMSAYFESANLPGCAHWMRLQSQEEVAHAMKFFTFVNDRGGRVVLEALAQPPVEFQSPLDVFQKALEHERKVSESIYRIYDLASKEKDYPTQVLLNWFVSEQVEEEQSASAIVGLLEMCAVEGPALIMLDRQLGAREHDDH